LSFQRASYGQQREAPRLLGFLRWAVLGSNQ
jgi:hypothetical protein